jgi:hypothetical protein
MPNNRVIEFRTHFALNPDETVLILNDRRLPGIDPPLYENGTLYLPYGFVKDYMDTFLFWDEYAEILFVTTRDHVLQFTADALEFLMDGEKVELETPIKRTGRITYLPSELVERLYPYRVDYLEAFNIALVVGEGSEPPLAVISNKADIRYRADRNAPIQIQMEKGERVSVYGAEGDYTRIRTADGLVGYVLSDLLEESDGEAPLREIDKILKEGPEPEPVWPRGVKVNLMWEGVWHPAANELNRENPIPHGVNVISPTWFHPGRRNDGDYIPGRPRIRALGQGSGSRRMAAGGQPKQRTHRQPVPDRRVGAAADGEPACGLRRRI